FGHPITATMTDYYAILEANEFISNAHGFTHDQYNPYKMLFNINQDKFVSDEAELKAALENTSVRYIEFLNDITVAEITSTNKLLLSRSNVTINGMGHTLNLPTGAGWSSTFFQVYGATNVVIENLTIDGGDAALLVNASEVTLTNVTLSN